jgi:hypothetical protein
MFIGFTVLDVGVYFFGGWRFMFTGHQGDQKNS